ncbi:MAG: glycosyltransferase family 4 protein [Rhodobacteraceae bacterium]|nr:glycosyltransferase family 4 protein [Paracoccaceae bacterium]
MPALFVTNFNPRFTGVSSTAAAVFDQQIRNLDAVLVGHPLPGCPEPITLRRALALSRTPPKGLPFSIWHVRRNSEMQAALFARDILGLPIRIVFTSAAQRRHSIWPRWLISRMNAVIATTEVAASFVPNVNAVVPHGVDTDRFTPASDRNAAWRATGFPGDYGIVTVGRIRPEKGTDLFVKTMIKALPSLPSATAVVIGMAKKSETTFLQSLKDQVAAAGLTQRILFPGEIAAQKMPQVLQGTGLLIALPRYEGYGITPLEAMACGVPVIASTAGHFAKFVGEASTQPAGKIVAQEDWTAAADATVALLSDPSRYAAVSANARNRTIRLFGIATETAGIRAVYDQLWHG